MLFPFVLGAFMNKEKLIEKFKLCFEDKQCFVVLSFACLTFLRCLTEFSFLVHLAYTCCIILFFCVVRIPMNVRKIFIFFGKLSTVVWFIHAYLLWYLWSGVFYGLKYPPFIFLAIIAVSFICGGAINVIYKKIKGYNFKREFAIFYKKDKYLVQPAVKFLELFKKIN